MLNAYLTVTTQNISNTQFSQNMFLKTSTKYNLKQIKQKLIIPYRLCIYYIISKNIPIKPLWCATETKMKVI
jgi:hypothetical protein